MLLFECPDEQQQNRTITIITIIKQQLPPNKPLPELEQQQLLLFIYITSLEIYVIFIRTYIVRINKVMISIIQTRFFFYHIIRYVGIKA